MKIYILKDPMLEALPEYGADDAQLALKDTQHLVECIDVSGLTHLDRAQCDVLVLPYINGEISESALESMIRFHEAGGSLCFLGQLPHKDRWAPTRNFHAPRLHLTGYCGSGSIDGLTDKGVEILGELPGMEQFSGRTIRTARTTAFPPDRMHQLIHQNNPQNRWEATPIIVVERFGRRFLGARLAQVGFYGGEPRENAAGGYKMPWEHDAGLMTRTWPGMDLILQRLVEWLQPQSWAGALDITPVHVEDEEATLTLLLRNLDDTTCETGPLKVVREDGAVLWQQEEVRLEPGTVLELPVSKSPALFGVHTYRLLAGENEVHCCTERVLPVDIKKEGLGFGFSTYWAFQHPEVSPEFRTFCHEMQRRGARYVRCNVPWEDIEPEPGVYDWRIPDALIEYAKDSGLKMLFWMFPTTRGTSIGDAGVPAWTLQQPAVSRDGENGFFPSIWSPYYQQNYFALVEKFTKRYRQAPELDRFVIDFGNSDFAYGYFYYVNDLTLFDYSEYERKAFSKYLTQQRGLSLSEISIVYGRNMNSPEDIPVPLVDKDPEAWRLYLSFRAWSLRQGIERVGQIVKQNAPDKTPPDLPGHGAGSIADLSTYCLASKAAHWEEEQAYDPKLTGLHNAGPTWGGEAWQVGARFDAYDDALFQSVRLGAEYNSIPGPDIGVYGDDIARVGFIRNLLYGAQRARPEIAVLDQCEWDATQSLSHVSARMDQPVDLLSHKHRYDFSCYKLLVLPPDELKGRTATGGGQGQLIPPDQDWYLLLRKSIEAGLNVLIFPQTAQVPSGHLPHTYLRPVLQLDDVHYGERTFHDLAYPNSFGGGHASGMACPVEAEGEVVVRSTAGAPMLVRRPLGKGAIWLAGWDTDTDAPDGPLSPEHTVDISAHSLVRLAQHLGIHSPRIHTGQQYLYKEWVKRGSREFFLAFSHQEKAFNLELEITLDQPAQQALDASTGEIFSLQARPNGNYTLRLPVQPRTGRYLIFQ